MLTRTGSHQEETVLGSNWLSLSHASRNWLERATSPGAPPNSSARAGQFRRRRRRRKDRRGRPATRSLLTIELFFLYLWMVTMGLRLGVDQSHPVRSPKISIQRCQGRPLFGDQPARAWRETRSQKSQKIDRDTHRIFDRTIHRDFLRNHLPAGPS